MRRSLDLTGNPRLKFQFTHPGKGATGNTSPQYTYEKFQFTHPGKGATKVVFPKIPTKRFQFTHPGKGATLVFPDVHTANCTFQFTHPGKGATQSEKTDDDNTRVSIHAPWEGCDALGTLVQLLGERFNSRTLGRVRRAVVTTSEISI